MKSLAYVLLILGSWTVDLFSDAYLRPHHIAGTNPSSWDAITTVVSLVGLWLLVEDRKQ